MYNINNKYLSIAVPILISQMKSFLTVRLKEPKREFLFHRLVNESINLNI